MINIIQIYFLHIQWALYISPFTCMYMCIFKDTLYKKTQHLFITCHHNSDINVALICSLLEIAVMHMPYKKMYVCVRLYKSQEKNNISQFSKYNPIWTIAWFVNIFYILCQIYVFMVFRKMESIQCFSFGLMETVGFFFLFFWLLFFFTFCFVFFFGGWVSWVQKTNADLWN